MASREEQEAEPSSLQREGAEWLPTGQACAALSREARIVLGCLEILASPTVASVAEVTGISSAEVRRCIGELHAVGAGGGV